MGVAVWLWNSDWGPPYSGIFVKTLNRLGRAVLAGVRHLYGQRLKPVPRIRHPRTSGDYNLEQLPPFVILDMSLVPNPYAGIDIAYSLTQPVSAIHLFRMDAQGNPLSLVADSSYTSGTVTDYSATVAPGSVYRYAIFDDQGNLLDFASLYTATQLSASVNGHAVTLNWANNDSTLQFDVQRNSPDPMASAMHTGNLGNLSSYTDSGLAADSVFTYQVNELTGNTSSSGVTIAIAPDAPTSFGVDGSCTVSGSSGNDMVLVGSVNGVGAADQVNVYDNAGNLLTQTGTGSYQNGQGNVEWWQNLAAGTTYQFHATNVNHTTGLESSAINATYTTPYIAPAVSAIAINPTATSAFNGKVASFAPSGSNTNPTDYTASIDWGDSTTPSTGVISLDTDGSFVVSGQHTYDISTVTGISSPLNTTVTITHTLSGSVGSGGGTAMIAAPVAPVVTAGPISATAGQPFSGQVASFVGVGPDTSASEYTALITWGDDSATGNTAGTVTRAEDGTFTVSGDHTYANAGNCNYWVTITHTASGEQGIGSGTAAVAFTAPVVTPHSFRAASGQSSTNIIATFTGSTAVSQAGDYMVSDITWADGSSADTVRILDNGNGTFSVEDTHAFSAAGNYTADVTVTHVYSGLSASTTASAIIVSPGTPLVSVDPVSATEGQPFSDVVATFTPTAAVATTASNYSAQITLGSQAPFAGTITPDGHGGFIVSVPDSSAPTYNAVSTVPLTVSVTYSGGGTDTQSGTLDVQDALIHVTAASIDASRGVAFNGLVASFYDENPSASPSDFSATVDWGDGSTPTAGTVDSSFNVSGSHTYDIAGDYTVTTVVYDGGGASDSASQDITVAETAPDAPTGLTATKVGADEIDLSWNPVDFATSYDIYRASSGAAPALIDSVGEGVTFYQDTNGGSELAGHTTYTYTVQATNDGGSSPDSNTASATTDDNAPIAPNIGPADAASSQPYTVSPTGTVDIPVLDYASDPDGDPLTIASAGNVSNGSVSIVTDASDQQVIRYTPASGSSGAIGIQTFTYTVTDGTLTSKPGTVTVDVINEFPRVTSATYTIQAAYDPANLDNPPTPDPITGTVAASDPDGDALTCSIVSGPEGDGGLSLDSSTGNFTYTPHADSNGDVPTARFVVKANDGYVDSNYATLIFVGYTMQLNPDADPNEAQETDEPRYGEGDEKWMAADRDTVPYASDASLGTILQSQTLTGALPTSDGWTFHQVSEDPGNPDASGHSITLNPDGTYTYTAPATLHSDSPVGDWFTYYITDSNGNQSSYATAFVTVQPVKAALTWSDQPAGIDPSYNETVNLNNDIENPDGIPDNQEPTLVPGDADVRTLNLKVTPSLPNGSTVTLSLPGGGDKLRVWQADGVGGYTQILGYGSASTKTWTVNSQAGTNFPSSVIVEGMNVGDFQFQMDVTVPSGANSGQGSGGATPAGTTQPSTTQATTKGKAVDPRIAVFYTDPAKTAQEVAPTKVGNIQAEVAYVPVNSDNDNYAVAGPVTAAGKNPAIDQLKAVPDFLKSVDGKDGIQGEKDLVHVVLRNLKVHDGRGGDYSIPNLKGIQNVEFAFFSNPDKTGFLDLEGMTFDSAPGHNINIWVEARKIGSPFTLSLTPKAPGGARPTSVQLKDFELKGPQNVPGNGQYQYTATVPNDVTLKANMWNASGGATAANQIVQNGVAVTFDNGDAATHAGKVENVTFTPASGFVYTLPINVVRVEYSTPNGRTNQVLMNQNGPKQSTTDFDQNGKFLGHVHIDAAQGAPAMDVNVDVTLIGPVDPVSQKMRGVRFIDAGFMQTGSITSRRMTLQGNLTRIAPDDASKLPANTYPMLDAINNPSVAGKEETLNLRPWYNSASGLLRGAYKFSWPQKENNTPATDATVTGNIAASDRPFNQALAVVNGAIAGTLQMDFTIILAAHTIDEAAGSSNLYFSEGQANWHFDGSGTIGNNANDKGVWTPAPNAGDFGDGRTAAFDLASVAAGTKVLKGPLFSTTLIMNEALNQKIGSSDRDVIENPTQWK